ncbi:unnamed protein product [Cladocopium goreaui]|uniref:Uncharacterized protein n=1 Tax=Cladocopium goreaui TaxID=2562237 RepID=A0A9P1GCM6_9DINO|nr:unnamed protein product [Cladocopium goreaui]|mmetsp:Transcript_40155/g.86922  ORF Transcript_40155/g.86922 Transcript_40155/m.86922 type:complete len:102 (-) Transcript_40155:160-465(-)
MGEAGSKVLDLDVEESTAVSAGAKDAAPSSSEISEKPEDAAASYSEKHQDAAASFSEKPEDAAASSSEKPQERRSENRVELLERSKLTSCGHGAKASFVAA